MQLNQNQFIQARTVKGTQIQIIGKSGHSILQVIPKNKEYTTDVLSQDIILPNVLQDQQVEICEGMIFADETKS